MERSAEVSRKISGLSHSLRTFCDFQVPPATLFTDHFINQFFLMSAHKRTWWVEGPAFCGLSIEPGARILELGCGTGYYTEIFFSPFASEIVAVDIDPRAIEFAKRFHQAKNIRYEVLDFRKSLPEGPFNTVIWSPTIVAYTPEEVDAFMTSLRTILAKNARLCGWTAVEAAGPGEGILWHDLQSLGARLKSILPMCECSNEFTSRYNRRATSCIFMHRMGRFPSIPGGHMVLGFDDGWGRSAIGYGRVSAALSCFVSRML